MTDFHTGDQVRIVPAAACGDHHHTSCRQGTVAYVTPRTVAVSIAGEGIRHCAPAELVKLVQESA